MGLIPVDLVNLHEDLKKEPIVILSCSLGDSS